MGFQESPFNDGAKGDADFRVKNLTTGDRIEFSSLVPGMISR